MLDDDLLDVSDLKIKNVDEVIKEKVDEAKILTSKYNDNTPIK